MARSLLRRPPPPDIPQGKCLAEIRSAAGRHGLTELLEKHLLSGFLLTLPERRKQWPLSLDNIAKQLSVDTDLKILQTASWIQVPILTVQGTRSQTISMLIGLVRNSTECRVIVPPVPDRETIKTVDNACRTAGWSKGVACWFLQAGDEQPVSGQSLALPTALALDFLKRSTPWPPDLFATGGLALDGRVLRVDGLKEKYDFIACSCRLFLTPAGNLLHSDSNRTVYGCATLDEARFAARLYSDGAGSADIALYQACMVSEEHYFRHFHKLTPAMAQSKKAEIFFQRAADDPEKYLEMLTRCFSRCSHDRQRGQRLAEMFTPETILSLTGSEPSLDFAAFNWCLAAMAFYNHQGRVTESRDWCECAGALYENVDRVEIVKAVNHGFICNRFNRYDFRPELTPDLAAILETEEKKQETYPGSNYLLGALYGTLAQNFGFCGPACFSSLVTMTEKARQAFGRKYLRETERLFNYEIYGHLDCGNLEQARKLLRPYLGPDMDREPVNWPRQIESLLTGMDDASPFRLALVLRFLGDTGYRVPAPWMAETLFTIRGRHGHPWQLIALNLGRMAIRSGALDEAGEFLRHSRDICLSDGDTMRPMALLPLAELHKTGHAEPGQYCQALEISQWLERTTGLKRDHFRPILGITDGAKLLQEVNRQRARLFPFSYR